MTMLAVAVGGAVGAVLRYIIGGAVQPLSAGGFPVGTLAVNFIGCTIVGVLAQMFMNMEPPSVARALLVVGFCGGFTTFSAFTFETVGLLLGGEYTRASIYVLGSTVLCVAATAAGMLLVRMAAR